MKPWLLIVLLTVSFFSKAQEIDVLHYTFVLRLSDKNDSINGYTEITYLQKQNGNEISFDLSEVGPNGKGMKVFNVQMMQPLQEQLRYKHENQKLIISSPLIKKGDSSTIAIWYKGIPADGLIISKNKYGDKTFFADNWPNRAHNWIPCVDKPDDKASFEFAIEAPSQYQVISNGMNVTSVNGDDDKIITHWKEDTPLPTKVMVIGVAKFATKTYADSPPNVPISAWVYPQDSAKGFYDYAITPGIVKFFSGYIAPFPYKKLANVQSKTIFGGMENASCIFYAESSVTGDRSEEDLFAHEIAHQWFGDMASEKSFAHLWLSEGFATYMTDLYFEHKYGKEAMNKRLEKERNEAIAFAKISTHAVVDSTKDLMSLLNANSYQKGAWVLHMLRNEVGDSMFQKIIQTYYNQYKGSNADTRDFEAVAEKVSGKDLKWFFDQWLYRPGIPRLSIKKIVTKNGVEITVQQLQNDLYRFTLPVSLETKTSKEKTAQLSISERIKTFLISKDKQAKIEIDPYCTLLFEETKSH